MSVSFHAFRNIGFSFNQAEAACGKWRSKFTGFDIARPAKLLNLDIVDGKVEVHYFEDTYRLNPEDGVVEKLRDGVWSDQLDMNEALVIYHYLGDTKDQPQISGVWVPESTLDPVTYRTSDRTAPMLKGFASDYTGKLDLLAERCKKAGGVAVDSESNADAAWEFRPLAQVPLRLLFWEADEDFPAQAKVQVDRLTTDYLHYEAVGFVMADLFLKIDQNH